MTRGKRLTLAEALAGLPAPGDFLFVPAGVEHRFEEFTDDLAVWVVFYGPDGGERPRA